MPSNLPPSKGLHTTRGSPPSPLNSRARRHQDGREVEITLARPDRAEAERHLRSDAVYLGLVMERLRAGRMGDWGFPAMKVNYAAHYLPEG